MKPCCDLHGSNRGIQNQIYFNPSRIAHDKDSDPFSAYSTNSPNNMSHRIAPASKGIKGRVQIYNIV